MDHEDKTPAISFEKDLGRELRELRTMLLEKNKAYGNSALDPVRLFSKADAVEQLRVRIDDKLSRLQRGNLVAASDAHAASAVAGEDTVRDLLGYLVLLRIAERRRSGGWMSGQDALQWALERKGAA